MKSFQRLTPALQAIVLMVVAMFVMSLMDITAKDLSARYDTLQVVWARFAGQAALSLMFLAPRLTVLLKTSHLGAHVLRSALLFATTIFFFFGLASLQLATVAAIFEVAPLLITVAAFFILGEKIGPRRWIGVGLGLTGALIIIRPGSDVFSIAALFPLGAALCFAGFAIATRRLAVSENPWTSFLYTALIGTLLASLIVPFVWITPTPIDILKMLTMGLIASVGHFLLIRAFTLGEASVIAPFGYAGLLFNALWGMLFFAEVPDAFTISGSLVIVGSGLYVWHREYRHNNAKESPDDHVQKTRI